MPSALKRKSSPGAENAEEPSKRRFAEAAPQTDDTAEPSTATAAEEAEPETTLDSPASASATDGSSKAQSDRLARFAALRARNNDSRKANHKATTIETQHLSTDPALLNSLNRKRENAEEKLLKADTEDAGEDYDRKRAWDWTIDESEKWDRKLEKRRKNRENNSFQDFTQDAQKVYDRQIREMKPNKEAYDREKVALIERAAASGGLEVVETEDGELIAVDRDGSFYSTAESTEFVQNKPSKEAIDKLVGEIRKAEEVRLKKRAARRGGEDDADVTYINDKNKQVSLDKFSAFMLYTNTLTVQPKVGEILQQVHLRDPGELRAWNCAMMTFMLAHHLHILYHYERTLKILIPAVSAKCILSSFPSCSSSVISLGQPWLVKQRIITFASRMTASLNRKCPLQTTMVIHILVDWMFVHLDQDWPFQVLLP